MRDETRHPRRTLAATIAAALLAPACQVGILDNRDDTWRAPPEKLKEVSAQDLVGRSAKPPVSPEEATREALEGKGRIAEYDAMQDLSLAQVRAATLENNLELRTLLYDTRPGAAGPAPQSGGPEWQQMTRSPRGEIATSTGSMPTAAN